jgi:hypothetical protein
MQYAFWIGIAVVLLAVGPPIVKNLRSGRGSGDGGGDAE